MDVLHCGAACSVAAQGTQRQGKKMGDESRFSPAKPVQPQAGWWG